MPRPRCFSFTVLFALTAFCPSNYAQDHSWSIDGPAFAASARQIQTAAARIKPEPFMDVTVLFEQKHYRLDFLDKATRVHELLYRIETKAGVDDWSQTSVEWKPWYQNQPSIRARVIQPDGSVTELDPHTLTDVPAKNEEDDTFSDARIYKGPLPSLSFGTIVEEETTVIDDDSIKAGQQANLLSKNSSFADLHTLACLYAGQGKTTEARQLLLDAMAAGNQAEPNSAVWFGFGSIYEELGLDEAAIAAYRRVDAPDGPVGPIDTYNLAQTRLKNLHGNETHLSRKALPK